MNGRVHSLLADFHKPRFPGIYAFGGFICLSTVGARDSPRALDFPAVASATAGSVRRRYCEDGVTLTRYSLKFLTAFSQTYCCFCRGSNNFQAALTVMTASVANCPIFLFGNSRFYAEVSPILFGVNLHFAVFSVLGHLIQRTNIHISNLSK